MVMREAGRSTHLPIHPEENSSGLSRPTPRSAPRTPPPSTTPRITPGRRIRTHLNSLPGEKAPSEQAATTADAACTRWARVCYAPTPFTVREKGA